MLSLTNRFYYAPTNNNCLHSCEAMYKNIGLGIIRHTYQLYPQRMKEIRLEHNKAEQENNLRNKLSVLKLGKF